MLGLENWWRRRRIAKERARFSSIQVDELMAGLPLLGGLDREERRQLVDLALLFLCDKTFEGAKGLELTGEMRLQVALQAALLVLRLGLDWYRGWYALILYPDEFVPKREWVDDNGLVWVAEEPMSGEVWEQGPVILSWADAQAGQVRDGYNVVLHELAHKLDLRDGSANGHPPLHRDMSNGDWSRYFARAYRGLTNRVDGGEETPIDPYAAQSPAEFFAVVSEAFFELPHLLADEYPAIYGQLRGFYRQDPGERLSAL